MVENLHRLTDEIICQGKYTDEKPTTTSSLEAEWEGRHIQIFGSVSDIDAKIKMEYPLKLRCRKVMAECGKVKLKVLEIIND